MANIDTMLYGERHDLVIYETLTRKPLRQNVPTQAQLIDNIGAIDSTPIDMDQMLLDDIVRSLKSPQTQFDPAPTRIVQRVFSLLSNIPM